MISRRTKAQQLEVMGQLSLMPGFQAVDKRQILTDKLQQLLACTQTTKSSQTSLRDSTSEGKVLEPFWNELCEVLSQLLSLPTKIDYAVSGLTSSNGSASYTAQKSWFCSKTTLVPKGNWLKIFSLSCTCSVVDYTGLENTSNKLKKTQKFKQSSRHQSAKVSPNVSNKIRVYPDLGLKKIWWSWMSACRYVYNQAIAALKDNGIAHYRQLAQEYRQQHKLQTGKHGATDSQFFRNLIMNSDLPEWVQNSPCHIRQNAIEDAWDAHCQALANAGSSSFRSFKLPSQSIKFNPSNFSQGTWYPQKVKGLSYKASEPIPVECLYGTQLVKQRDRWYAVIPEVKVLEPSESTGVIALDPGVRSFLTGYDGTKLTEIANGDIGRIYRLCQHLDKLISRASKAKSSIKRRMLKAANRMRFRIRNLVDEIHHQVARWLVNNYKLIMLPTFETSNMVRRATRKIGSKSVRAMMNWSHFRFKSHLKQLAARHNVIVLDVDESYTSKTCSQCGCLHASLGGNKTFKCSNCGIIVDRDWNGVFNIMLKTLRDSAFAVSDDGIAFVDQL